MGESKSSVVFHINGEKHTVNGSHIRAGSALVDYIRDVANLKGTKVMCREGGCGACTVTAKVIDPGTGFEVIKSVNSCLTPVLSCDGWDISTVERLGNRHEGYHVLQKRLVNFFGTQCGFCTPGMIMNMHGLYESKKDVGIADVDKNLDGNLCRCTGYRPILDAFKSLAKDAPGNLKAKCSDIEDCGTCPLKKKNGECSGKAVASSRTQLKLATGEEWITAKTIEGALAQVGRGSVRFVAGNTSTGIFKNEGPYERFVDINGIHELKKRSVDSDGISFGGLTTLTELINLLRDSAKTPGLEYGSRVVTHLERVANVSVRNNGTIAGNLMIKHKHNDFPSDVFVILEALAAKVILVSAKKTGSDKVVVEEGKPISILEFLSTDMNMKLIKSIHLPKHDGCHFRSFKITRRYQNAHAYVNAALLLKVNKEKGFAVEERPRLVFGGISASFVHASATEAILHGKGLKDPNTLKAALEAVDKEMKPEGRRLEASPEYRMQLVRGLLYKTILEIVGDKVGARLQSGAGDIVRNISSGKQFIEGDPVDSTLYKTVPKREAGIQASGEAEYTGDIPFRPDELFAAYVTSTIGCGELKDIDASEAMEIPGVFRLVTGKDIPGENQTMKDSFFGGPDPAVEPVFATDKIQFYGQPLGLILATSRDVAMRAAKLVKVTYQNVQKPVITIEDAIAKAKADGTYPTQTFGLFKSKPIENIKVVHTLEGAIGSGSQYHFYMEPHSVICHPREDGIDVFSSSQAVTHNQGAIANVLGIPSNSINIQVRRVGGGFGGKSSLMSMASTACAVATWVTNRPVRLILDLESNMSVLGKRHPYRIPYEVGFDEEGRIGSLKVDFIGDTGYSANEANGLLTVMHVQNVYKVAGWEIDTHKMLTNTPSNTFCRAPASVKAVALIEWVMDRIANHLGKDPIAVRQANLLETGDAMLFGPNPVFERPNLIPEMIEHMKKTADYEARKAFVEKFNRENRWKKRGMSVVPVRYEIDYFATNMPTSVAIYHMDGHVAISHGGVEMGQGINTKLIQTVAQILQIPMDRIKVKPTNSFIGANVFQTAASITSELACYSIMRACEEIRENLRPILEKLENPSWERLIQEAHTAKVKLTASYTPTAKDDLRGYDVWILNVTEVEIDVLTGEYKVVRTDLYEDTGKSLSPGIDIGQIEGAYIHGQGYWTTEKIVHDENTGKLLTNGTWDYKIPETKDIPEDFRITLLTKSPNPLGVLRSKATGEPSTDAAFAVVLAMRNAIASARKDAGNMEWFEMYGPVTPEDIARLCLTTGAHLTF